MAVRRFRLRDLADLHAGCSFSDAGMWPAKEVCDEIDTPDVSTPRELGVFTVSTFRVDGLDWILLCPVGAHGHGPTPADAGPGAE